LAWALLPLVRRSRQHDPGCVLVDLAVTAADGGVCVSDLAPMRAQPNLFGQVASQPTAWRLLDSIDEPVLARIQAARARARARVWAAGLGARAGDVGLRRFVDQCALREGRGYPHLQEGVRVSPAVRVLRPD